MKKITLIALLVLLINLTICSATGLYGLFPIQNYDQNLEHWIHTDPTQANQLLLSPALQKEKMQILYQHLYASDDMGLSAWSKHYIQPMLTQSPPNDILGNEYHEIAKFTNTAATLPDAVQYGENFRPYSDGWIKAIQDNMQLQQFAPPLMYHAKQRAIAITNLQARILPTIDPSFYRHARPGEGYPFDNLQISAIWAGTPLYIVGQTKDHAFDLVSTASFIGWVDSTGVAPASPRFIKAWQVAARKHLVAITHETTPMIDQRGNFRFSAYIGSLYPLSFLSSQGLVVMIPIMNAWHQAKYVRAVLSPKEAVLMPMRPTQQNALLLLNQLLGRPYGWGNLYFNNDCSSELQSFYLPFGIWLPRHSAAQVTQGKMIDLSQKTPEQRLLYLSQNGHPFFTIIYIGKHVFMFVGNGENPQEPGKTMVLVYQDIWAFSPPDRQTRSIIGGSVLLPLLTHYPEDPSLIPLNAGPYFQVSHLDELPSESANI